MPLNNLAMMLARPTFGQGLFQVGQQISSISPRRAEQQRQVEQQQGLLSLASMAQAGAQPESLEAFSQSLAARTGLSAEQLMSAQKVGNAQRQAMMEAETEQRRTENAARALENLYGSQRNPSVDYAIQNLRNGTMTVKEAQDYIASSKKEGTKDNGLVVVGNYVFDKNKREWLSPPSADSSAETSFSVEDIVKLYDNFEEDGVKKFLSTGNEDFLKYSPESARIEAANEEQKRAMFVSNKLASTDELLGTIDKAKTAAKDSWAPVYDIARFLPMSDARELDGYVSTLKANLTFDRLQQIRSDPENKTGGALGQVSNQEGRLLANSVAALDPGAGDEVFLQQLETVQRHYNNFRRSLLGQPPIGPNYVIDEGELFYVEDDGSITSMGMVEQ